MVVYMENREIFSTITAIPPVFVRLDGRAFHGLAEKLSLKKPFDERFKDAMVQVCTALVADSGLNPEFALPSPTRSASSLPDSRFNGRVEKIDSVTASFAIEYPHLALGWTYPLSFDARVIPSTGIAIEVSRQPSERGMAQSPERLLPAGVNEEGIKGQKGCRTAKGLP